MKFSLIALLFTLIPLITIADSPVYHELDYAKYHEQTMEAERLISEEKFAEALQTLESVFNSYAFVFLRDYKIAAQLATYLDQKEKAFHFIQEGIAAGWELKAIDKGFLAVLHKDPDWRGIEEAYPALRRKFLERIDHPTREKVQAMFKRDQWKALGALLRIGDKAQERYAVKKFAPHSEGQMTKLIEILKEQGYPGEKLIGNDFWMSTIISHHNSISPDYSQKDTLYNYIKPMLLRAIQQGEMSPYEFALIDDWQKAVSSDRTEPGYGFLTPPRQSTLAKTNQLRQKIGLRTVGLRNKLVEMEKKTGMNFYLPDWIDGKIQVEP